MTGSCGCYSPTRYNVQRCSALLSTGVDSSAARTSPSVAGNAGDTDDMGRLISFFSGCDVEGTVKRNVCFTCPNAHAAEGVTNEEEAEAYVATGVCPICQRSS